MSAKSSFLISIGLLMICLHQFSGIATGSPFQLNLKKMFDPVGELRAKKDIGLTSFTPPDEDVIELEHLKSSSATTGIENKSKEDVGGNLEKSVFESAFDSNLSDDQVQLENLPLLEKQLEAEAEKEKEKSQTATGQPEREEEMVVQHKTSHPPSPITPPHLNGGHGIKQENDSDNDEQQPISSTDEIVPPAPPKLYHGAARLAFGQHPEILPTTKSTTTSTTTTTTTTTSQESENSNVNESDAGSTGSQSTASVESVINSQVEVPSSSSPLHTLTVHATTTENTKTENVKLTQNHPAHPGRTNSEIRTTGSTPATTTATTIKSSSNEQSESDPSTSVVNNEKSDENDDVVAELEATKTNVKRRAVKRTPPPKSAESLLRNSESSFDMAQYVFWTGDEAGVARAVEEFIQQGLMSKESALKFLKEIRMGIEYLQKSYANRVIPEQKKRDSHSSTIKIPLHINDAFEADSIDIALLTDKPSLRHNNILEKELEQHSNQQGIVEPSLNLQKTLDHLPSLMRIHEASNANMQNENTDYDETVGRAKIAEFLYAEYSLEEVIYQLAKVMFSQSLTHGSEQSQRALQRLTNFLEHEGQQGVISPALQKKILDVLLAALSDTLTDHPELLATARAKLGHTFLPSEASLNSLRH